MSSGCGFQGNSDLYGLGLRIGVYVQWLTTILAYNLSIKEMESIRGVNVAFQLATFAGLIRVSADPHPDLHAVEAIIILLFCFGTLAVSSVQPLRHAMNRVSGALAYGEGTQLGKFVGMLSSAGISGYGTWLAFVGMDTMPLAPCDNIVFCFAPVQLYGRYRTALKAAFIVALVVSLILLLLGCHEIKRSWSEWVENWKEAERAPTSVSTVLSRNWPLFLSLHFCGFGLLVAAVELTIFWNNIYDIYTCNTVSQLFPVVVSLAGLSRFLYKVSSDFWRGDLAWHRGMSSN